MKTYCSICCRPAVYLAPFGYRCKRCNRATQPFYMLSINNISWRCLAVRKEIAKGRGYKVDTHSIVWSKR